MAHLFYMQLIIADLAPTVQAHMTILTLLASAQADAVPPLSMVLSSPNLGPHGPPRPPSLARGGTSDHRAVTSGLGRALQLLLAKAGKAGID